MMSPTTSAVVLAPAVAVALTMAMALQLSAAAPTAVPPPPPPPAPKIGLPGCDTTCGNVSVPYQFGISPGCSWPGLNLTCDRPTHDPPRLLLGDGTLRVTDISIEKPPLVRVVPTGGSIINTAIAGDDNDSWNVPFGRGFTEHGYLLSSENELVVLGCNVVATLLADGIAGRSPPGRVGGCASLCTKAYSMESFDFVVDTGAAATETRDQCTGTSGCCKSPVTVYCPPIEVEAKRLYSRSDDDTVVTTVEEKQLPVNVFVAEKGWIDDHLNWSVRAGDIKEAAPFVLQWSVTKGLPPVPHPQRPSAPVH